MFDAVIKHTYNARNVHPHIHSQYHQLALSQYLDTWARIGFCMSNPLCLFQAYLGCLVHVAVVHFDDFFMDISCHCYDPRHCPLPSDGTAFCWQLYLAQNSCVRIQSTVARTYSKYSCAYEYKVCTPSHKLCSMISYCTIHGIKTESMTVTLTSCHSQWSSSMLCPVRQYGHVW